jgi:hypothetical protein
MDILAHDNESARAAGGRLGAFSRGFHALRERVLGKPPYEAETPPPSIAEEADAIAERAAGGTIRKSGDIVNTPQHAMLRSARQEIDSIHSGLPSPEPSSIEDLFPK